MPKIKTNRGAAKRFKKTGTGKIVRKKAYLRHQLSCKTRKQKRHLRGSALVEREKDYVVAARCLGLSHARVMFRHLMPNCLPPLIVVVTVQVANAISLEATLSFLGVGLPSTQPSLGTLIRLGNELLQSGEWWITVFPAAELVALVLAINVLGDWLRDALNPRLR